MGVPMPCAAIQRIAGTHGILLKRARVLATSLRPSHRRHLESVRPLRNRLQEMEGYLFLDFSRYYLGFFPGFCLIWLLSFLAFGLCLLGVGAFWLLARGFLVSWLLVSWL